MLQAIFYPVQVHAPIYTLTLMILFTQLYDIDACVFSGKGAVSASAGSAPLQEHHHPEPEAGRGSFSTTSQSSSFYHTDAANTTGTQALFLCVCVVKHTSMTDVGWGKRINNNRWGKRLSFFLQRDLTGSNLSVNTDHSLPMTTQYPLHHVCVCVWLRECLCRCLLVWLTHVCTVL